MTWFWNGNLPVKAGGRGGILAKKSCQEIWKLFVEGPYKLELATYPNFMEKR